ncbi:MAG: excinuclease ABC subunit A, partial [Planctomycetota bacterium]
DDRGFDWPETNWNHRSVVELTGPKKSDGWFLHALTGEKWLLKLKFRTAKNTFKRDELATQLDLKPLNDLDDVEAYGAGPRVKCKNLRTPWQEVQVAVHSWKEIDTPEFWSFVDRAAEGFIGFATREQPKPEDLMPWKKLGQKWHLARKGFAPGKKVAWQPELLEDVFELLAETAEGAEFLWNNKVLVHVMAPGKPEPWATVVTKRPANVEIALNGPKGEFQLGRFADLGAERLIETDRDDRDTIRIRLVSGEDLDRGDLAAFLQEHLDACRAVAAS